LQYFCLIIRVATIFAEKAGNKRGTSKTLSENRSASNFPSDHKRGRGMGGRGAERNFHFQLSSSSFLSGLRQAVRRWRERERERERRSSLWSPPPPPPPPIKVEIIRRKKALSLLLHPSFLPAAKWDGNGHSPSLFSLFSLSPSLSFCLSLFPSHRNLVSFCNESQLAKKYVSLRTNFARLTIFSASKLSFSLFKSNL